MTPPPSMASATCPPNPKFACAVSVVPNRGRHTVISAKNDWGGRKMSVYSPKE